MSIECLHENMVAYTEDGERFNACRGCNQIFPRFTDSPTGDATPTSEGEKWEYRGHYFKHVEGHLNKPKTQPFTVTLTANASCSQSELDAFGAQIVREHNAHRKLVEALEDILSTAKEAGFDTWPGDTGQEFREACERAALALAEVQQ